MPDDGLEVEIVDECAICGQAGVAWYRDLRDHTFGSPGLWNMNCCGACELLWLNPRPIERDIGKVYRTYYTHGVQHEGSTFRAHVGDNEATRRWAARGSDLLSRVRSAILATRYGYPSGGSTTADRWIARLFGLVPGVSSSARLCVLGLHADRRGRVLDVGCGNGSFLARMKSLGWNCVGTETDSSAAQFARERFGLDVLEGSLPACQFPDHSFDVITVSHVIEHVHSPEGLIEECRRVLRPEGTLIVLTPNTRSLGHRIFHRAWRGLEPPRHLWCFNPRNLKTLVERTGMRVDSVTTESRMMRGIWYASRVIERASAGAAPRNSFRDYVSAYAMQLVESIAIRLAPGVGEEIVLVAQTSPMILARTKDA
jgi:2-polyprenyl-3-methyl-5-hydroxy-6-metoxy-1,4-benzoquinol methylase